MEEEDSRFGQGGGSGERIAVCDAVGGGEQLADGGARHCDSNMYILKAK